MQREDQTDHGNGPGTNSSESAVNHLSKSVVRESRTPRSVGTGGGRPLPVTRSQGCNSPALLDPEDGGGPCPILTTALVLHYRRRIPRLLSWSIVIVGLSLC